MQPCAPPPPPRAGRRPSRARAHRRREPRTAGRRGRATRGSTSRGGLLTRSVEQHARDLRPSELRRQVAALVEQLTDGRTAQRLMHLVRVRTRAARGHTSTRGAVEAVLEPKDLDTQLARCVLVEDAMRCVGVVVVPDAGVVAADNEMGATVVAAHYGVEHGLLRAGV